MQGHKVAEHGGGGGQPTIIGWAGIGVPVSLGEVHFLCNEPPPPPPPAPEGYMFRGFEGQACGSMGCASISQYESCEAR